MDDIAVGIVLHGGVGGEGPRIDPAIPVLRHVNASRRHGTPWRGFAANHNDLMSRSRARWYVALNPDVEIDAAAIRRLVRVADEAGLAVAGPAITAPWGASDHGKRGFPSPRVWVEESVRGAGRRERSRSRGGGDVEASDWLSGACLAIRRDLGLRFDERYFMYFEDADLCRRAWQRGLRVGLCSTVTVHHASGWSPDDPLLQRRGVEFARSAIAFARSAGVSARAMTLTGLLRFGSRLVLPGEGSSQRAAASGIARGFANPSFPGLSELAAEFNAARDSTSRAESLDAVV